MDAPTLRTIHVVGAIIIKDKKVLSGRRRTGNYAGWWEFPGGKINPGETPEAALIREIREELDVGIRGITYFDTTEYDYPEFHVSMRCYLCELEDETLTLREHSAVKWLGAPDIYSVKWLEADLPILKHLLSRSIL